MSTKDLKRHTTRALRLEDGTVPEAVFVPPAIRGKMVTVQYVTDGKPTDMSTHMVRIEQEADPVGMLIAVAMGQPIPTFQVGEDGEIQTVFESLSLKDRLPIMRYLADKILPRMSVNKKIEAGKDDAWEATITNAGENE